MTTPAQTGVGQETGIAISQTSTSGKLAAVAYLNMLPFFANRQDVELFTSPRALNSSSQNCQAYCSSLIAGIAANKSPITSQFGVFSSGPVMSVFIEPVLHSESHTAFWKQLEELWAHRHPDPVAGLNHADAHGEIILLSSGASEQSLWMLNVLCALAGFKTISVRDDLNAQAPLSANGKKNPEARLWIGDAAIERRLAEPLAYRIDVGQIWNSHTGHKAWFAAWFAGQSLQNSFSDELENELMQRLRDWHGKSEFSRWCSISSFLESQNRCLLKASPNDEQNWELRDCLDEYFKLLEFVVGREEGAILTSFYRALHEAFTHLEKNWAIESPQLNILNSPTQIPVSTTNAHRNVCQGNPG
ncbi:MAG: MqnA/MqnD/SBP family protein [Silvanigrellaceae bacterium]